MKNEMGKKVLMLGGVVSLGVVLGVLIVSTQSRREIFQSLLQQQANILSLQQKMLARESGNQPSLKMIQDKQEALDKRLEKLESQWQKLQGIFNPPTDNNAGGFGNQPPAAAPVANNTVHDIAIAHSSILGKKEARVTIVEFVDFQCPFCARFHKPILEVMKAYPNQVRYILKNYPLSFHPQAKPAAKAAFAAGEQGKYYEMADVLLENQSSLSEDKFKELAKNLGLNVDKFMKDYKGKDDVWEKQIEADIQLGNHVGVGGTPTFFVNGRETMSRDFQGFKKEIDEILNKK